MNNKIILPYNIEKNMTLAARKEYYKDLKRYCIDNVVPDINNYSFGQKVVTNLYMKDFYTIIKYTKTIIPNTILYHPNALKSFFFM